jgi:Uncharacterised nucleotidyltransferase
MLPGKAVAGVLAGAWRSLPSPLKVSREELRKVIPLLCASGAGALGWWRLRQCYAELPEAARRQLRAAYLDSAILAAKHEQDIVHVVGALRHAGIEPILLKGWAVSRLYPEAGLRPSGDIDLYVRPEQHNAAQALLNSSDNQQYWVDLSHDELTRFGKQSGEDLYKHSRLAPLHGSCVRVFGAEDQLRTLCLHFIKHGGWRPVWLCDIAATLESRPVQFDWDRCLPRDKRYRQWVLCTLSLAHSILDAELGDAPVAARVPNWMTTAVLKQWGELPLSFLLPIKCDVRRHWRAPGKLLAHLLQRWPNPIQATVDADRDFDCGPRLPLQIRHCLSRARKLGQRHDGF